MSIAVGAWHYRAPTNPTSSLKETREFRVAIVESRKNSLKIFAAQVSSDDFAEDRAEVGGKFQIAALVQLFRSQPWPLTVNFSAFYCSTHHKHAVRVAVVGAAVAVFVRRASEFGHGYHDDVFHAIAQILVKRGESLSEIAQQIRKLPLRATFIDVIVPAARIHEAHFQSDVAFDELRDLLQRLPDAVLWILRAVFRLETRGIGLAQHFNSFKCLRPGAAHN